MKRFDEWFNNWEDDNDNDLDRKSKRARTDLSWSPREGEDSAAPGPDPPG